ncbi:MAG: LysM peptidoglycan-binding domain-containing protein, partial [Actinomycetota bacterium]|nr:LysM peptidoglycan-binding domain-containing protein [Actinomycetota bacterium]
MSPMPADLPPVAPTVSFALHAPVSTGSDAWRPYRVKEGDTLYDLAAEHDTSVAALVKHNQLGHGGHWIMSGSVIELPTGKAKAERSSSSTSGSAQSGSAQSRASSSSTSSPRQVTMRPGDTLSHLSLRYDVSVASIVKANGLSNPRMIHAGQTL